MTLILATAFTMLLTCELQLHGGMGQAASTPGFTSTVTEITNDTGYTDVTNFTIGDSINANGVSSTQGNLPTANNPDLKTEELSSTGYPTYKPSSVRVSTSVTAEPEKMASSIIAITSKTDAYSDGRDSTTDIRSTTSQASSSKFEGDTTGLLQYSSAAFPGTTSNAIIESTTSLFVATPRNTESPTTTGIDTMSMNGNGFTATSSYVLQTSTVNPSADFSTSAEKTTKNDIYSTSQFSTSKPGDTTMQTTKLEAPSSSGETSSLVIVRITNSLTSTDYSTTKKEEEGATASPPQSNSVGFSTAPGTEMSSVADLSTHLTYSTGETGGFKSETHAITAKRLTDQTMPGTTGPDHYPSPTEEMQFSRSTLRESSSNMGSDNTASYGSTTNLISQTGSTQPPVVTMPTTSYAKSSGSSSAAGESTNPLMTTESEEQTEGANVGMYVGISLGLVAIVTLAVIGIVFFCRRWKKANGSSSYFDPEEALSDLHSKSPSLIKDPPANSIPMRKDINTYYFDNFNFDMNASDIADSKNGGVLKSFSDLNQEDVAMEISAKSVQEKKKTFDLGSIN